MPTYKENTRSFYTLLISLYEGNKTNSSFLLHYLLSLEVEPVWQCGLRELLYGPSAVVVKITGNCRILDKIKQQFGIMWLTRIMYYELQLQQYIELYFFVTFFFLLLFFLLSFSFLFFFFSSSFFLIPYLFKILALACEFNIA